VGQPPERNWQAAKREVRPDIAIDHQERIGMNQIERPEDAATGLKASRTLRGLDDTDPESLPVAKRRD